MILPECTNKCGKRTDTGGICRFCEFNFPTKTYKTVVIDPPWPVDFVKRKSRPNQKEMPYGLMSLKDIENLPINEITDDEGSYLFLWTTQKFLPISFEIMKKWGFKYHVTLTWDKNDGMVMFGVRRRTEFVLFGYKGKVSFFKKGKPLETFFCEKLKENSRKPDIFYENIRKAYPEPRVEIFSRKTHYGFSGWGDEVEETHTMENFF